MSGVLAWWRDIGETGRTAIVAATGFSGGVVAGSMLPWPWGIPAAILAGAALGMGWIKMDRAAGVR